MPRTTLRPPVIVFEDRSQSSDETAAIAAGWLDFVHDSMGPGSGLTALALSNHPDAIALFFALSTLPSPLVVLPGDPRAWRSAPPIPAGTPLFLPPSLRAMAGAADVAGARVVVAPDPRPPSAATGPPTFLTTPGIVHFTSGSTGLPKPVYVLVESFVRQAEAIVEACQLAAGSRVAASVPLATSYGLARGLFLPTVLGARLGLLDRFDHRALLRLFASAPYDYWAGTPLMASMLARATLDGPRPAMPRICHISTGALTTPVFRAFHERFGVPLRPAYGQTENGFITADTAPAERVRAGGVGRAAPGIEVRIGDDPLDPFPPGRAGRVWFSSARYMEGYGFPPDLAPREGRQGWWPTPDIGRLDATGYLTLVGRADDCFKTPAGYLVSPAEIADALMSHPAVTDVAVLPVSSGADSQIGVLVESPRAVDPEAVRVVAARTLPAWLRPSIVVVRERLPRLASGKIDLEACRVVLRARHAPSRPTLSAPGRA
jgi:long-chain acyl-CoA synthetase